MLPCGSHGASQAYLNQKGVGFHNSIVTVSQIFVDKLKLRFQSVPLQFSSKNIKPHHGYERFVLSCVLHKSLQTFYRYGDALNPWGDLIVMARSWCLVKPGGYGLVGVPTGPDNIAFNSHKIYGRHGLAQIFANWEQVRYKNGSLYFL